MRKQPGNPPGNPYADTHRLRPIALHIGLRSWVGSAHEEHVASLLAAGAPVNLPRMQDDPHYSTPLHSAANLCHPGIIRRLLQAGALVGERAAGGLTPLHRWADGVAFGHDQGLVDFDPTHEDCVESGVLLVLAGADPEAAGRLPSVREVLAGHGEEAMLHEVLSVVSHRQLALHTLSNQQEEDPRRL